jgi:sugar O-acyltransferase (sialic acid O-acetyltransferase NeuD family)
VAKVVVFGLRDFASLAHFYLSHDSDHEVVAFAVHAEHAAGAEEFEGLPVAAFEDVDATYSPSEFAFFAPMSPMRMNRVRAEVFYEVKRKGYRCISYVSSHATIFPRAVIGENCFILEDNTLQPFTPIGDNVVLWSGNHIGHHGHVGDHVFFTSHVVLSGHCTVEPFCFFGVNATVRDGLRIAEGTLVGMGACVTRATEPWGVYTGNPATKGDRPSYELDL